MNYKKLDELLEYIQPTQYIVKSENYDDSFSTPVLTAGKSFILGYTDETNGIYFASKENPIILLDDFTTECKLVDFAFKVKSSACKILKPKKDINIKYVYYAMKNIDIDTALHKRYWISIYSQQTIPFPSPIIQENIVSEIEAIKETIEYNEHKIKCLEELIKSQFIEMFNSETNLVKMKTLCQFINGDRGKNYPSAKDIVNCGIPFINAGHLNNNIIDFDEMNYITEEKYELLSSGKIEENDILYCLRGSLGKKAISRISKGAIASSLLILRPDTNKILPLFLLYSLEQEYIMEQMYKSNNGSSQPNLSAQSVKEYDLILPELSKQIDFADFVQQIDKSKFIVQKEIKLLEELLEVKMNEYFS